MNWPPSKAWTRMSDINGHVHFVAINYGGELPERWVLLMSVLDSSVVVNVTCSQLFDKSYWECGWIENEYLKSSDVLNRNLEIRTNDSIYPSFDSGLTIPITKDIIRPWFSQE